MQYINPFSLLNIKSDNLADVNNAIINRAKRKLLAEIELSDDNTTDYYGYELTKSDCIRVIDELDNKDKKEFHFYINQNEHLNNFLSTRSLSFFENYKIDSIYKLPEFLDFISPYFCEQYDKILSENYKTGNEKAVNLPLFSETQESNGVSREWKNQHA